MVKLMQLDSYLLSLILNNLTIEDKFRLRVVNRRWKIILDKLISKINRLNLKQKNLCNWTNSKFNESTTINIKNFNQISKILNKFNSINFLKLKFNCVDQIDYSQLNLKSTKNLQHFFLLTNTDSIYKEILQLNLQDSVVSFTFFCNKFENLKYLSKHIGFLNYFKKLLHFSCNLRKCYLNQNDYDDKVQIRNNNVINLHLSYFIIDSIDHLKLIKSFVNLKKLTIFSIRQEYLESLVYFCQNLTYLIINNLNTNDINLENFFKSLIKFKFLKFLKITVHQLKFDLKLRLILTDFLLNTKIPKTLIINEFKLRSTYDLNRFQSYLNFLPANSKQVFDLKNLTLEELIEINYQTIDKKSLNNNILKNVRSLLIKKYTQISQVFEIKNKLKNLNYLELNQYAGNNTDEIILNLLNFNSFNLKVIKLIKVSIKDPKTFSILSNCKNVIHLEIQLNNQSIFNTLKNNLEIKNQNSHKKISNKQNDVLKNLYALDKLNKLQKLILVEFSLNTNLLLHLLKKCSNLYLIKFDRCHGIDPMILQNEIRKKNYLL